MSLFTSRLNAMLLLGALLGAPLASCTPSGEKATVENLEQADDTLTEEIDGATITWFVSGDGKIKALLKGSDGKPADKATTGTVTVGATKVPLKIDEKSQLLVGDGPKLQGGLTEAKYTITSTGKTWNGTLHLPDDGTAGLAENAKKAASKSIPTDQPGPNGGVVQVVDDEVIEVVADKNSGQVRVYVLDSDLKPVPAGDRKIKLAIQGNGSEVIELSVHPDGYLEGKVIARTDPLKLTILLNRGGKAKVALVGFTRGKHVVVRPGTIRLLIVNPGWKAVVVKGDKDDKEDKGRKDDKDNKENHGKKDDPPGKKDDHPGKGNAHGHDKKKK